MTHSGRRIVGFLRSFRGVYARAGARGLAELVFGRALPRLLSYERVVLIRTPIRETSLSDMRLRRVHAPDSEVEELFAGLARTAEPEVPGFSPDELRARFAAGHELWLFSLEGQIVHARWLVADRFRFAGWSLPLHDHERSPEGAVTPARFRARGVSLGAREHVRTVLAREGASTMLSAIHGFNRAYLTSLLRIPGAERLATVHAIGLGGRRWLRAAPADTAGTTLLEERGMPTRRWISAPPTSGQA